MVFQCWAVSAASRYHSSPNVDGYGTMIYRLAADTRLCRRDLYNAAEGYCHVWPTGPLALQRYRPPADNSIGYETITLC
jgi:hypothetical protein